LDSLAPLLNQHPLLALAILIVLGKLLGNLQVGGFALGTSGVLFIGMVLGHLGVQLPDVLGQLGVALFVYSVGLQAGPHFWNTLRQRGVSFLVLASSTLLLAWVTSFFTARWLGLESALASGVFSGALTSTPGLAASLQVLESPNVSVGFGIAYPLGVIGVILFVQLVPRLRQFDWEQEIERAKASVQQPAIQYAWIRITNPQMEDKTIQEVEAMHMTGAIISRVYDKYVAMPPHDETHLALRQHVRVVGTETDLQRMELLLGPRVTNFSEPRSTITSATLVVTENSICGQTLQAMQFRERYGVTITRIWRDDFEFVPDPQATLEFGDEIRIVGDTADCQRLTHIIGLQAQRLNETRFLPLGIGLLAGILVGRVPIPLPSGNELLLGLAGGPLVAGLVAGHFGRLGPLTFRMPVAARMFINELGLVLFLSSAGIRAGEHFWQVLQSQGPALLAMALAVTLIPLSGSFLLARYFFHWDALTSLGAMCGAMTSTPGLGAVTKLTNHSAPSTAYVAVYPLALLLISLMAPLLGVLLGN
jgi:putative transport protein